MWLPENIYKEMASSIATPNEKTNEWRESNLQKRGFELIDTLQADNPDAVIGKVAKT